MRHWGFVVLLGWVCGVALQLQQADLSPMALYGAALATGLCALGGLRWVRRLAPVLAMALLAGVLLGWGLTGARAVHFAADALEPTLQGIDIEVTGRIASLPQRSAQGERFDFVVESASRAGQPVQLPPRLQLPESIKEVFIFSLVSDHYPALAFQTSQFLQAKATDVIRAPLVMDVFFLDTLTEMLRTPLRLLSYVRLRVAFTAKLMSGHELTVLGYHLKMNLWLEEKNDFVYLDDSVAQELDTAMLVRRDKQVGDDTPAGILTKMRGTLYERLIQEIERRPDSATLELGFHLLSMNENSCKDLHVALGAIMKRASVDGARHDITLASSKAPGGISLHCNPDPSEEATRALESYCAMRKYKQRADEWYGVSVSPSGDIQFGVTLVSPWEESEEWDKLTADMKPAELVRHVLPSYARHASRLKLGRNDPCHCGSGVKYKKCCL